MSLFKRLYIHYYMHQRTLIIKLTSSVLHTNAIGCQTAKKRFGMCFLLTVWNG